MIKISTDTATLQDFGKTLTIILFLLSIFWGYQEHPQAAKYLMYSAFVFAFVSLFVPRAIKYLYVYWLKLANIISQIVTKVILFVLYFGFIVPYSLLVKLFKGDLLNKKIDSSKSTYWIDKDSDLVNLDKYRRQF